MKKFTVCLIVASVGLTGCKYYGSALNPEYPQSMDNALAIARDKQATTGGQQRPIIKKAQTPELNRPAYLPEKELAVVAPPKTLLVWSYPHVTENNTRVFGGWSTIFLTDRYEWVLPANEMPAQGLDGEGYEPVQR